jgi:hypothetical protein
MDKKKINVTYDEFVNLHTIRKWAKRSRHEAFLQLFLNIGCILCYSLGEKSFDQALNMLEDLLNEFGLRKTKK